MGATVNKSSKIYVAGHRGMVGSAIVRCLTNAGYKNIIKQTHSELDLLNQKAVNTFFEKAKPDYVFLAAAKVGGIYANTSYPAEFIFQNMTIGFNVIHAAYKNGVKKLMNLGSTCIYPKMAEQPIKEESLLTGPLEPSNDAYAVAKISVIKLCEAYNKQYGTNFLSVMPTNLYGIGDNYDLLNSHVLPAMIRKFYDAARSGKNEVVLWGDGSPLREFLFSDDLANAVVYLMEQKNAVDLRNTSGDFVNVGSGNEITIMELAKMVRDVIYEQEISKNMKLRDEICHIVWDTSKPNGTPRKLCDISRLTSLGFTAKMELKTGIKIAYLDFLNYKNKIEPLDEELL
ncbi:MAG: GDP-L-fucose synthase [Termitinemataceae bacterium]|nr:MAG: GDP-L-fucose synthase [Termitinemataceae bacterium]